MEEEKFEEKIKRSPKKIAIIVFIVLILLAIVAVGIWYFIFRDKDIQELDNEPTEENIQDFEAPVITGIEDREIVVGEALNFTSDIVATDNIDGEVEFTIDGEVDNNTVGEYVITIRATDKSGNSREESFKVTVKEKEEKQEENEANKKENEETQKENEKTQNGDNKNKNTTINKKETTNNKNNTTKTETTESKNNTTPEKPKLTGTDTQKELTNTETKYGVIINTYTTTIYNLYSDGTKTVKSTRNSTEYDRSNYSATTAELLPEARAARSKYASMISRVLQNTNSYRQEANVNAVGTVTDRPDLVLDEQLTVAACVRAVEMVYSGKFDHIRPNGDRCYSVATEMGISAFGENIAYGYSTADAASIGWKNSSGHYANMISRGYTKIGIGVFKLDGYYYWVQLFG